MPDRRVQAAVEHWAPRFITMGVDWGDFVRTTGQIERWEDWLPAWSEGRERADALTLRGVAPRIRQPAPYVTGGLDRIVPWRQTERAARETPNGTFVLFEHGSHVCSNIPYRYRPLVADWMAERLASAR
jgi:pimeloyl-ACP methyl ester carboxylesterase